MEANKFSSFAMPTAFDTKVYFRLGDFFQKIISFFKKFWLHRANKIAGEAVFLLYLLW